MSSTDERRRYCDGHDGSEARRKNEGKHRGSGNKPNKNDRRRHPGVELTDAGRQREEDPKPNERETMIGSESTKDAKSEQHNKPTGDWPGQRTRRCA